jgi:hypothetical protein
MILGFIMYMATCSNGWKIVGIKAMMVPQITGQLGQRVVNAQSAFCVVAPGSTFQEACALVIATGLMPIIGTTSAGFEYLERLLANSADIEGVFKFSTNCKYFTPFSFIPAR